MLYKLRSTKNLKNVKLIPQNDDAHRYMIKLTRLPESLYPLKVEGTKISSSAIGRFYALERRLDHPRNKKLHEGVHERVKSLIADEIMVRVGLW